MSVICGLRISHVWTTCAGCRHCVPRIAPAGAQQVTKESVAGRHQLRAARDHRRVRRRDDGGSGAGNEEDGVRVDHQPAGADRAGRQHRAGSGGRERRPASSSTTSRSTARRPTPRCRNTFLKTLKTPGNEPAYIHCARGNRAAAMWMIKRISRRPLGYRSRGNGSGLARSHQPGAEAVRDRLRASAQTVGLGIGDWDVVAAESQTHQIPIHHSPNADPHIVSIPSSISRLGHVACTPLRGRSNRHKQVIKSPCSARRWRSFAAPMPGARRRICHTLGRLAFGSDISNGRAAFGISAGGMGAGIIGGEVDFGWNPSFFGTQNEFGNNSVLNLMGNVISACRSAARTASASVRISCGGVGLIRNADRGRWPACSHTLQLDEHVRLGTLAAA